MNNMFNNFGKRISWIQILFVLCIILLTVGVFLILSYSSKRFAIPLFAVGVITVIIAAIKKRSLDGWLWLLADGCATTVLATMLMSGIIHPFAFAVWELALGCFKVLEAHKLKRDLSANSRGFLYIAIAEFASGTVFFIKAADAAEDYGIAIVTAFIIQMNSYALRYYFYPLLTED